MRSDTVDFYYFTGTGNTFLVVRRMAEALVERGYRVHVRRMERSSPAEIDRGHTIGLGFPVAAQTTYPLVWRFAEALPAVAEGTEVFMVDTMASYSGGIVGPLRKTLADKGYAPIGAREIVMPVNFGRARINLAGDRAKIERGLRQAEDYVTAIIAGSSRWGRIPIASDLMAAMGRSTLMWNLAAASGRKMSVDRAKCTRCGLCSRICPTGNIIMDEYPRYLDRCEQCLRCLSFCPETAIAVSWWKFAPYRATDWAEIARLEPSTG